MDFTTDPGGGIETQAHFPLPGDQNASDGSKDRTGVIHDNVLEGASTHGECSVTNLPIEVVDEILQRLPPIDVATLGTTSWAFKNAVVDYYARSLTCLLRRFFNDTSEITEFRSLQATYGILISGWSALQFFMPCFVIPDSALDIYVQDLYVQPVMNFLHSIGFGPTVGSLPVSAFGGVVPGVRIGVYIRGVQRINVIVSKGPPLQVILSYHSTVVMNIITHDRAYSFFPHATFNQKLGMTLPPLGGRHDLAREKYRNRGWDITRFFRRNDLHPESDLVRGARWVGDSKCLVVVLPPIGRDDIVQFAPSVAHNSWMLRTANNYSSITVDVVILGTSPRNMYCSVPGLVHIIHHKFIRRLQKSQRWSWDIVFRVVAPKFLRHFSMPGATTSSTVEWFRRSRNMYPIIREIKRSQSRR